MDQIDPGNRIGFVTAAAARGSQRLYVNSTQGVTIGQWVRLVMDGATGALVYDMNGGERGGGGGGGGLH